VRRASRLRAQAAEDGLGGPHDDELRDPGVHEGGHDSNKGVRRLPGVERPPQDERAAQPRRLSTQIDAKLVELLVLVTHDPDDLLETSVAERERVPAVGALGRDATDGR
jgi:hypothetical protein